MERKLASIRKINKISPIKGADRIELARVDGWNVVVAKNAGHKEGDLVVYFEIDSFLPIEPEFEFLRKSSYKKLADGTEGFRLRTIKLKNTISQGLIIPMKESLDIIKRNNDDVNLAIYEGRDLTNLLGVTKYEPPIPANLAGEVISYFPPFIPKTDETRIQNLVKKYNNWKNLNDYFYVAEKLDGASTTFYYNQEHMDDDRFVGFGVCSRNLNLKKNENNSMWKWAIDNDLEFKLKDLYDTHGISIALQGEIIGEGIQKNPYKIKGQDVRFFSVIDIKTGHKYGLHEFKEILDKMELKSVPILAYKYILPDTIDEVLKDASSYSILYPHQIREGIVIRNHDSTISFKAINNEYLL